MQRIESLALSHNCKLDLFNHEVIRGNTRIPLSRNQFRLIYRLAHELGHPVNYDVLIQDIWGTIDSYTQRSLYLCVHRVRKRIEDDVKKPRHLLGVRGVGYMLSVED